MDDIQAVLDCPMVDNDVKAPTVRVYFRELVSALWYEGECFSGKRPFGNSDWQWKVYESLAKEGILQGITFDRWGYIDEFPNEERDRADQLIQLAISSL